MEDATAMRSLDYQDRINQRDNETRIEVAEIQARARMAYTQEESQDNSLLKLKEDARQFNDKIKLAKEQLNHSKKIDNQEVSLKREALSQRKNKGK